MIIRFAAFLSLAAAFTLGTAGPALAAPTTLQCRTDTGAQVSQLVLDLKKRRMRWGISTDYKIIHLTKRFITAVEVGWMGAPRKVGSEIWVIDRASGAYWRASIYEVCAVADCKDKNVEARTFKGVCR